MHRVLSFHGCVNLKVAPPVVSHFLPLCHSLTHSLFSICSHERRKKALKIDLHASVASSFGLRMLITTLINW